MKFSHKIKMVALSTLILLSTACENNYLDINSDPNYPSSATSDLLLSAAQPQYAFAFAGVLSRITSTLTKQIVNWRYHRWQIGRQDIGNSWRFDIFGGALQDLEVIITQETVAENWRYVGVAKLQKAYIFSIMTDLFGDLPFSEFGKSIYPIYEDDAEVYDAVLDLIDEAIADLDRDLADDAFSPGQDDYIYRGNIDKWKKMANTLKLKMYNQIRLVDTDRAKTAINALIGQPESLILSRADNFSFPFFNSASPENRHPNFVSDYPKTSRENYMSVPFYNMLDLLDDPRLPYYLENQNSNNTFEGQVGGSLFTSGNDDNSRTLWGVYPVGGRFNGSGPATGTSGTGDVPLRMISSFMTQFIIAEAELMLNSNVPASEAAFIKAMEAAFVEVNSLQGIPDIAQQDIDDYIAARVADFQNAADNEERLDVLITQKYLANFGNGIEVYNDFRRTGYPSMADISHIQDPLGEGVFPRRLPYDNDEFQGPNPPDENILLQTPVFWDTFTQ